MAMKRLSFVLAAALVGACGTPLRYEAPRGFASATQDWRSAHYKASDNVGLKLLVFDNVEGGTLQYWGTDLVRKLQARQYALRGKSALTSGNGVAGTRFDFTIDRPGEDTPPQFLVVSLFVTDDFIYVAQLAGHAELLARYDSRVPEIVATLRPRGCRPGSRVCDGKA